MISRAPVPLTAGRQLSGWSESIPERRPGRVSNVPFFLDFMALILYKIFLIV
ncbi:MAG: hypothetical protein OP8BY_0966 [Candidatus Saccharicenans subterraneus]|uniref:Uncharacterized protein n=1 Tax=Candidatus Saccharicenans subterraneus TaxID=2508984 RepID=A0A3E2BQN4_9BACT|nr:MAG: hypothetical protein OP8BY_0966 [Candidatus Saccharicenans subterraneum]